MSKIIIELEGGLVQAVWSTDKTITVEIMDRDIPENDEDAEELFPGNCTAGSG